MTRHSFALAALAAASLAGAAGPAQATSRAWLDERIAHHAARHGVPARLVHRIVVRESRYQPHVVSRGNYGLMQIKPATARGMGYGGAPAGLLDPEVNLTYAVPYLANAWRVAGGDENRAVSLYAGGYYYVAKRRGMLASLRTARSAPVSDADAPSGSSARPIAAAAPRRGATPQPPRRPVELVAAAPAEEAEAPTPPAPGRPDIVRD